ncbi:hypothetical protein BAUCODRAFT_315607 [Baudoinia panamericana UAMH 10762]|uniref:Uncharacterized protein n=1 Tax=Baudoinia panamericana (strain UAMH 10762) TaxID=717646 RepID=M2MXY0_BAUPA|nr:uncharacterized protein BAUCODRAFT_315607 [Baudoinia panamericana UAMH 10762]EMC91125.1 hypothetical protein BAUCODRAFT_315607 [Baudoinia panamericana UAMH 10762]
MEASHEKTAFGATIVPQTERQDEALIPPPTLDSPALTPAVSRDDVSADYHNDAIPPHSPFYHHAESKQYSRDNVAIFEKDLESGNATPLTAKDEENPFASKLSVDCNKECSMWPSRQTLMRQKTAEKQKQRAQRGCAGCGMLKDRWTMMSKRNQLLCKLVIALFIVGAIVGVCVGISIAVHGTYYSGEQHQQQVGAHR